MIVQTDRLHYNEKKKKIQLTISRGAIVDIAITERAATGQIPTDPNRDNLTDLIEQIVELRVCNVGVEVPDVKRSRHELIGSAIRTLSRRLNWNLDLRHYSDNKTLAVKRRSFFMPF